MNTQTRSRGQWRKSAPAMPVWAAILAYSTLMGPSDALAQQANQTLASRSSGSELRTAGDATDLLKSIEAVRVSGGRPVLDGRLDDEAWALADPRSDFQQKGRDRGFEPRLGTVVRFLYDDEALYVGAQMENDSIRPAQGLIGRRDEVGSSERILVSLDTYRDRRTSFTFGVTVTGVRVDYLQARDTEGWADASYDPDWTASVSEDSGVWTAEMRIPFSQLRFSPGDEQIWGLNVRRWNPTTFLNVYWVVVPYYETGWTSRFGELTGIEDIDGGASVGITPYLLTRTTRPDASFGVEPVSDTRFGGEAKIGLGSNLTLDATVNPDFGQVEADPARVNLSAFETFFPERRPFFLEGRELFRTRGPSYFYSRRVGSVPRTNLGGGVFEAVENTTVLGGAKVTGRLPTGLSVGVLGAVSDREAVLPRGGGAESEALEVAPRSAYFAGRLVQEFESSGSSVGLMGTAVERVFDDSTPIVGLLTQRAFAGGADWLGRFGGGAYETTGHLGGSLVLGSPEAITQVQLSSTHWYQRPDADHVQFDPTRTWLGGWSAGLGLGKTGGESWFWDLGVSASSPGFEIRDAGSQTRADRVDASAGLRYAVRDSNGALRNWSSGFGYAGGWNFGGLRRQTSGSFFFAGTWANLWNSNLELGFNARALSDDLTRGGPIAESPQSGSVSLQISGPSSNRLSWSGEVAGYGDEYGGWGGSGYAGFTIFAGQRLEMGLFGGGSVGEDARQLVAELEGGPMETFGNRYVFSSLEHKELFGQVRLKVAFVPDAILSLYTEPFLSSGRIRSLGELRAPGGSELLEYGSEDTEVSRLEDGAWQVTQAGNDFRIENYDFWVRSFRATGVFRWEWRRGSTLFLIWQRSLWNFMDQANALGPNQLLEAIDDPGQDIFVVKMSVLLGG